LEEDDYIVNLQSEGASAVLAASDCAVQVSAHRRGVLAGSFKVAVADVSYHGPPSTALGSKENLWGKGNMQCKYPVPEDGENGDAWFGRFEAWLDENVADVGVLLIEPQWGSSNIAKVWDRTLLTRLCVLCVIRNVPVVSDDVMCGLCRHSQPLPSGVVPLFLSTSWNLPVSGVVFGKSVSTGVYPMSGFAMTGVRGLMVRQSEEREGRGRRAGAKRRQYSAYNTYD